MSVFQIVPWEKEGEERRDVVGSAERCPLQAEVTEGALAGKPGRVRGRGIPSAGLGQKGPQRACDPIPSFYQWEDRDAPGKGLIQGHPGRPSQLPGSSKQPRHPPRWLCSHPSLGSPESMLGPVHIRSPFFLSLAAGDQRGGGVTEASSLLGGSPRRPCGRKGSPYHTGQLHPAVRVADLLQHINQMKTAEGYGFKQEYEVPGPVQLGPPPGPSLAPPHCGPWQPSAGPWMDPCPDGPHLKLISWP